MNRDMLADYFEGVAAKRLTQEEANQITSNQPEFDGLLQLGNLLGTSESNKVFPSTLVYLSDTDDEPFIEQADMSWYDSQLNQPFCANGGQLRCRDTTVTNSASSGDTLLIARKPDDSLLVVIAEAESTAANQMRWLFGVGDLNRPGLFLHEDLKFQRAPIDFARRGILENVGVEVDVTQDALLNHLLDQFGDNFPTPSAFSKFVRQVVAKDDSVHDADGTLMAWMTTEEILFKTLEKHIVGKRLQEFGNSKNVDDFIDFGVAVQERRQFRVGAALKNHLSALFDAFGPPYSRSAKTENSAKPDFLFPGIEEYRNPDFNASRLTMLGAKSTCKDRWWQVLSEAERIPHKHLLTLEPAISQNQTNEMTAHKLQLVLPSTLHDTYLPEQREHLFTITDFIQLVTQRQT